MLHTRIVKRLEQIVRTDISYIARGGSWLLVGQALTSLVGFATAMAFANLLLPETYGMYKFVLSVAAIVGAFSLTGMRTAIVRAVSQGHDGALKTGVREFLKWSFGLTLIPFGIAFYYYLNDDKSLTYAFLIVGALLPLFRVTPLSSALLEGKKDFKRQVGVNLFQTIIPAAFLILAVFLKENMLIVLSVYYLSNIFAGILTFWYISHIYKPHEGEEHSTLKYSTHLSVMGLIERIAGQIDKILMFHYFGAAQLALYSFALAVPQEMQTINKILKTLAFPKLSAQKIGVIKAHVHRKFFAYVGFVTVLFIAYFAGATYFYHFFLPQYTDAVPYSQLYALTFFAMPLFLFSQTFMAHEKTKELYATKTVHPLVRVSMMLVLIPLYGIWGAIIAELIAQLISGALTIFLFIRLREKPEDTASISAP